MLLKKLRLLLTVVSVLSIFFMIGCDSGSDDDDDDSPTPPSGDLNVSGYVIGLGLPISGANVTIGDVSTATSSGSFSMKPFSTAAVDDGTNTVLMVTVTADGYATGYTKIIYDENTTDYTTEITLLPISAAMMPYDNFPSGIDFDIPGSDGSEDPVGNITIPDEAYPDGVTSITGAITYIDPNSPDLGNSPGGDLNGTDTTGDVQMLESFGMMEFDLKDQDGNPITDLAPGQSAIVTMKVPNGSDLTTDVPYNIVPLWYFDPTTGLWKQEGQGEVTSDTNGDLWIVGTVTHFTWWNYDRPIETHACFKFTFVDASTDAPLTDYKWYAQGVSYNGASPERNCNCGGDILSSFTVKQNSEILVYTTVEGVRYYIAGHDASSDSYSYTTMQKSATVFYTPDDQGSCITNTEIGTCYNLDGGGDVSNDKNGNNDGKLRISGINRSPKILSLTADNPVEFGETVTITAVVTDPEGDPVILNWDGGVTGDATPDASGNATATFTVPDSGNLFKITLDASDLNSSVSASLYLYVETGTISGRVTDISSDEGVADTLVWISFYENAEGEGPVKNVITGGADRAAYDKGYAETTTNDDGYYIFRNVPLYQLVEDESGDSLEYLEGQIGVQGGETCPYYYGYGGFQFSESETSITVDFEADCSTTPPY